ncbi:hypothetical protein [Pseudomonas sediminis]|uniref:HEPN domain-containing protein n=1 Tax=Pseudomonas sediminis TaxID=1691904 RepID=A0ABX6SF40_9PSED|nr:hypothetical protein [Pseudomonas sediminis]QNH00126.1 hypothetical protein HNQ25_17755 [Pseudomonas sediminis]
MDEDSYNRFKELREQYYLAGRCLLVSNLYGPAGINFGYAIELSLKLILVYKGHSKGLRNHNIIDYYRQVVDQGYISELNVSSDFLKFANERLNTRYPKMIEENMETHKKEDRLYFFSVDMLHCYDDFFLQLDDALQDAILDPKVSTGFRCCRNINSVVGRVFFHCNDHAFQRLDRYVQLLGENRDEGDQFDEFILAVENRSELWNFRGMTAVRPWGPKPGWSPAAEFKFPRVGEPLRAAKWQANNVGIDMYLSSMQLMLEPGTYKCEVSETVVSQTGSNADEDDKNA